MSSERFDQINDTSVAQLAFDLSYISTTIVMVYRPFYDWIASWYRQLKAHGQVELAFADWRSVSQMEYYAYNYSFTTSLHSRYAAHFSDVKVHVMGPDMMTDIVCDDFNAANTCATSRKAKGLQKMVVMSSERFDQINDTSVAQLAFDLSYISTTIVMVYRPFYDWIASWYRQLKAHGQVELTFADWRSVSQMEHYAYNYSFTTSLHSRYAAHFSAVKVHVMGPDKMTDIVCDDFNAANTCATSRKAKASPTPSVDSTAASGGCSDGELEPLPEPAPSDAQEAPWEQIHGRFAAALRRVAAQDDEELWDDLEQGPRRLCAALAPLADAGRPAPAPTRARESAAAWKEVSTRLAAALERATAEEEEEEEEEPPQQAPEDGARAPGPAHGAGQDRHLGRPVAPEGPACMAA
ncbi:unnamed protein product [Prorocentrum cordatum]|uniref:Uncharacterized protein n=1 Tax=Prorocentrum cordatum TaxID=2364126 RepID=A0ABN9QNB0_9DINO|nr:unnamed protein product [Polarella glacialis]